MFTDQYIVQLNSIIDEYKQDRTLYNEHATWPRLSRSDLILEKKMGIELGAPGKESLASICFTDSSDIIEPDEIVIIGKDLNLQEKKSVSFVKLVFVETDKINFGEEYEKVSNLLDCKYTMNLKGYMIRAMSSMYNEWIRISNDALKKGLTLSVIGNEMIREFKKFDYVKKVKVVFIVDQDDIYNRLKPICKIVERGIRGLNTKYDDLEYNCSECDLEDICGEIDGMSMHTTSSV